jgi:hypothetical protein
MMGVKANKSRVVNPEGAPRRFAAAPISLASVE